MGETWGCLQEVLGHALAGQGPDARLEGLGGLGGLLGWAQRPAYTLIPSNWCKHRLRQECDDPANGHNSLIASSMQHVHSEWGCQASGSSVLSPHEQSTPTGAAKWCLSSSHLPSTMASVCSRVCSTLLCWVLAVGCMNSVTSDND